jgi:hypothetical protein
MRKKTLSVSKILRRVLKKHRRWSSSGFCVSLAQPARAGETTGYLAWSRYARKERGLPRPAGLGAGSTGFFNILIGSLISSVPPVSFF